MSKREEIDNFVQAYIDDHIYKNDLVDALCNMIEEKPLRQQLEELRCKRAEFHREVKEKYNQFEDKEKNLEHEIELENKLIEGKE